ncbi:MAG: hypothetical protein IJM15_03150 [Erysipelotrichaceae bacterium]|nr:hypothetical protein [Erysipelotrichaceae bacterium]
MSEEKSFFKKAYDSIQRKIRKLTKKEEDALKRQPKWFRICYIIIFYPLSWLLRKFLVFLAWLFSKTVRYTSDAIEYTKAEVETDKQKKQEQRQQ